MQEALSTKRFGVDQQQFPYLQALNGVQSLACFLWAGLLLLVIGTGRKGPVPPVWAYWKPGLTNAIGPACGYEALKNISYPAQVGHLISVIAEFWLPVTAFKSEMYATALAIWQANSPTSI